VHNDDRERILLNQQCPAAQLPKPDTDMAVLRTLARSDEPLALSLARSSQQ